jgi:hypothetical protein
MMMEAICCYETSVDFHGTTRSYIPGGSNLHDYNFSKIKILFMRSKIYLTELIVLMLNKFFPTINGTEN